MWSVTRQPGGSHVLTVEPFARLAAADAEAVADTGSQLLAFVTGAQNGRVELT